MDLIIWNYLIKLLNQMYFLNLILVLVKNTRLILANFKYGLNTTYNLFIFETRPGYVAQAGLELKIHLPETLKC